MLNFIEENDIKLPGKIFRVILIIIITCAIIYGIFHGKEAGINFYFENASKLLNPIIDRAFEKGKSFTNLIFLPIFENFFQAK